MSGKKFPWVEVETYWLDALLVVNDTSLSPTQRLT